MSATAVTLRLARTAQLRRLCLALGPTRRRGRPGLAEGGVTTMRDPIHRCVEGWHRLLRGELPGGLDAILADDVVFLSPIVFTPQRGKELTKLYLNAASATLLGGGQPGADEERPTKFRYVKEVLSGRHAVLEFEAEVDGKYVNGIDMLTCDEAGRITEFKVMIRPLQAIQLLHRQMAALLAQQPGAAAARAPRA